MSAESAIHREMKQAVGLQPDHNASDPRALPWAGMKQTFGLPWARMKQTFGHMNLTFGLQHTS